MKDQGSQLLEAISMSCHPLKMWWSLTFRKAIWQFLSFLVLYMLRHANKILIKMCPLSTDGAILILVFEYKHTVLY